MRIAFLFGTVTLENVSADHLRQVLDQVEDAAASKRLMAAITYKEFDDVSQKERVPQNH